MILRARDLNQEFKQDIIQLLCGEWTGGVQEWLLKLQRQRLGHGGSPPVPRELEHLVLDNEAASGELGGPQGFLR